MSADNFNYIRRVAGKWHVWLNLSASCELEEQLADSPAAVFDDSKAATAWANRTSDTEYGARVDDQPPLVELLRDQLALYTKIQQALDAVLEPTSTGYLHHDESWTVFGVRHGEYDVELEVSLIPPKGAYHFNYPSSDKLDELQKRLCCDRIHAFAVEPGRVRYIATYNRRKP